MSTFGRKYNFLYEYSVNHATISNQRICFTNTGRPIKHDNKKCNKKYALKGIVDIFYNHINPKQSVLEPGKKDGLLLAIIFLGVLSIFGFLVLFE